MKSYTDLEQSEILSKILKHESADMHYARAYFEGNESDWFIGLGKPIKSDDIIPCWSLAALIGVLPSPLHLNKRENINGIVYWCNDTDDYDNPVDACVEMVIKLHELNLL